MRPTPVYLQSMFNMDPPYVSLKEESVPQGNRRRRERDKARREQETEEQRKDRCRIRREKDQVKYALLRQQRAEETKEQRAERCRNRRERDRGKRASMSQQDREACLKKRRDKRNAKTDQKREARLQVVNKETTIAESPLKCILMEFNELTELTDIGDLATGQQVTLRVKVVAVGSSVAVKSELKKQECVVGDVSGCCRVMLWNDDIGKLLKEKSYKLAHVIVKQRDGVKYLSISEGSMIACIDDIGDVAEIEWEIVCVDDNEEVAAIQCGQRDTIVAEDSFAACHLVIGADIECGQEDTIVDEDSFAACHLVIGADIECGQEDSVVKGEIDAVELCDEYVGCIGCRSKVETSDGIVGECKECGMLMKMKRGVKSVVAKVLVFDGEKMTRVTLFDSVLSEIVCGVSGDCIKKRLLAAPPVQLKLDRRNVAVSVMKLLSSEPVEQ